MSCDVCTVSVASSLTSYICESDIVSSTRGSCNSLDRAFSDDWNFTCWRFHQITDSFFDSTLTYQVHSFLVQSDSDDLSLCFAPDRNSYSLVIRTVNDFTCYLFKIIFLWPVIYMEYLGVRCHYRSYVLIELSSEDDDRNTSVTCMRLERRTRDLRLQSWFILKWRLLSVIRGEMVFQSCHF